METPEQLTITCANGVEAHLLELEQHSTLEEHRTLDFLAIALAEVGAW